MRKNLSKMTLEELWQLFPIVLVEHQECWKNWYLEEETLLKNALSKMCRISHIGSTAIPNIITCIRTNEKVEVIFMQDWLVNLIVGLVSAILSFLGGFLTKSYQIKIKQKAKGNNNSQSIGDVKNDK